MPPKRGRKSQVEKPIDAAPPQKSNSRKKQAPLPEVQEEEVTSSPKASTSRNSRASNLKEESVSTLEVKESTPSKAKKKGKAAGRTTRASRSAAAVEETVPQAVATPKKPSGSTRNSRQKKKFKAPEDDTEADDKNTEITSSKESAPQNAKKSKKDKKEPRTTSKAEETKGKGKRRQGGRTQVSKVEASQDEEEEEEEEEEEGDLEIEESADLHDEETPLDGRESSPVKKGRKCKKQSADSSKVSSASVKGEESDDLQGQEDEKVEVVDAEVNKKELQEENVEQDVDKDTLDNDKKEAATEVETTSPKKSEEQASQSNDIPCEEISDNVEAEGETEATKEPLDKDMDTDDVKESDDDKLHNQKSLSLGEESSDDVEPHEVTLKGENVEEAPLDPVVSKETSSDLENASDHVEEPNVEALETNEDNVMEDNNEDSKECYEKDPDDDDNVSETEEAMSVRKEREQRQNDDASEKETLDDEEVEMENGKDNNDVARDIDPKASKQDDAGRTRKQRNRSPRKQVAGVKSEEEVHKVEDIDADTDSTSTVSEEKDCTVTEGDISEEFEGFEVEIVDKKANKRGIAEEQNTSLLQVESEEEVHKEKYRDTDMETEDGERISVDKETEESVDANKTDLDDTNDEQSKTVEEDTSEDKIAEGVEEQEKDEEAVDENVTKNTSEPKVSSPRKGRGKKVSQRNLRSKKASKSGEADAEGGDKADTEAVEGTPEISPVEESPVGKRKRTRGKRGGVQKADESEEALAVKTDPDSNKGKVKRRTRSQRGVPLEEEPVENVKTEEIAESDVSKEQLEVKSEPDVTKGGKKRRGRKRGVSVKLDISDDIKKFDQSDEIKESETEEQDDVATDKGNVSIKTELEDIDVDNGEESFESAESGEQDGELSLHIADSEMIMDDESFEGQKNEKAKNKKLRGASEDQEGKSESQKRKRKSRWDDPRKFEERYQVDTVPKIPLITSLVTSSSSVPVKIITTKKDSKPKEVSNQEFVATKEDSKLEALSKDSEEGDNAVQKFDAIVILANSLHEMDLSELRYAANPAVSMIVEEDLSAETIVSIVQRNKKNYPKNSLWVLVCGIHNMAECGNHPHCQQCFFNIKRLTTLDGVYPPIEEVTSDLQKLILMLNTKCEEVQCELGSDGVFILSPPIPVTVVVEDWFPQHQDLHKVCKLNYSFCADSKTLQSLHVSYNVFCDVWTKNACEWMKPYLPVDTFQNFQASLRGKNIVLVKEIKKMTNIEKQKWVDMIFSTVNTALATPFPERIPMKEPEEAVEGMFSHAVVIGNVKSLDYLKSLTTNFPVSFVDEDVHFDEEGITQIKEEQSKWSSKTICLILTGVSGIAEPLPGAPKCTRASCEEPLPIFVPKNNSAGDPDFKDMSNDEMVNIIVKQAFDFARNAADYMKEGSALFLAPVIPLRAIWGGRNSKFSHDNLHKLVESKCMPVFGGVQNDWLNCANLLENKWIEVTMENLEEGSKAHFLYETYKADKPDILQCLTNVNKFPENETYRNTWSLFVFNILKDFLYKTEVGSEAETVHPSMYEDIVKEAQTCYSQELVCKSSYDDNQSQSSYEEEAKSLPWKRRDEFTSSVAEEPDMWKELSRQLEQPTDTSEEVDLWKKLTKELEKPTKSSTEEEPAIPGLRRSDITNQSNQYSSSYGKQNSYNRDRSYQGNQGQNSYQGNQGQNSSYQGSQNYSYQDQNYSYQGQDSSYQDSSYQAPYGVNQWMPAPPPWTSGFPQGPPPGLPPWGPGPPPPSLWQSGPPPPMWRCGPTLPPQGPPPPPPPGPPPQAPHSWSSTTPPPWMSGPPPVIPASAQPAQSWQNAPPLQQISSQPTTTLTSSTQETPSSSKTHEAVASVKLGANIMVQNIVTDMKIEQAKKVLETFGELTYLKWPLDHLNKPAKFLMACYKERLNAEKCERVLNYVRAFGRESEVKLVGSKKEKTVGFKSGDLIEISLIQDLLNKLKEENSLKIKENSNRVVVSNISNLVPRKMIDAIFLSLKANRSFKNFDLSVISSEEELHFFVCGSILNVKMMDGYRFPDKKLKVKLIGPDEDKDFSVSEKEAARQEIQSLMKKHIDTLADCTAAKYISKKEVNIYTFKTVRCQNDKTCKNPGLCHDYHVWKDRRRCPILFKYSDEMCHTLDSNGKCPAKDKCSKAHSPLEVPFHLKNFRSHICQGARKKGYCNKTDKICAYVHPGTTETFYDRMWRDLYVEGLDKTITYFVGSILNLFKVSKQNSVRVLLITPSPEMVTLLIKSMEALSFSCDQEIQALPEDGRAKKAAILIGTPQAVVNWMAEEKKSKNINIDRLKALIIDDGPAVVDFIDTHGHNFLIEFAKIKDLNKVITAEKITKQSVLALERLRILTDYKKIYADDDRSKRSSSPRGRSSSPSRKRKISPSSPSRSSSHKYGRGASSSGHYSRVDDRQKYSRIDEEKLGYEEDLHFEDKLRQEREKKEEVMREQEMLLQEQLRLQEQIRCEDEMRREQEMRHELDLKMRHEEEMKREQERRLAQEFRREQELRLEQEMRRKEELRRDQEMRREQELRHEQELRRERELRREQEIRHEKEKREQEKKRKEADEKRYKTFVTSKEDLKREHERERKLYLEVPEVHPEYEEKYRVFLDQYKTHYPGRDDSEHCKKLWMLFWKELVSSMLETAYKKKREMLEVEYMATRQEQSEVESSSSLKRKAYTSETGSDKYPRKDIFDQRRQGASSSTMSGLMADHDNQTSRSSGGQAVASDASFARSQSGHPHYSKSMSGMSMSEVVASQHSHTAGVPGFSVTQPATSQYQQAASDISVPQAVSVIGDICNYLGELSPALRLVMHKVGEVSMDPVETAKIFTDTNNAMIMRIAAGRMKELSEKLPRSPNKDKLALGSYHALQLLELASSAPAVDKKPYHGLDIKKVARATMNKDPAFIIQFITNALLYEGVTDPTQDDISDIFVTITNTHYTMKKENK